MFKVANNLKTVLERRLCPFLVLVRGNNDVDMFFSKLTLNTLHLPQKVPTSFGNGSSWGCGCLRLSFLKQTLRRRWYWFLLALGNGIWEKEREAGLGRGRNWTEDTSAHSAESSGAEMALQSCSQLRERVQVFVASYGSVSSGRGHHLGWVSSLLLRAVPREGCFVSLQQWTFSEEARAVGALVPEGHVGGTSQSPLLLWRGSCHGKAIVTNLPSVWEETNRSVRLIKTRTRSDVSFSWV